MCLIYVPYLEKEMLESLKTKNPNVVSETASLLVVFHCVQMLFCCFPTERNNRKKEMRNGEGREGHGNDKIETGGGEMRRRTPPRSALILCLSVRSCSSL